MNVLLLTNGAEHHQPFYVRLGQELQSRGHHIHFAADSHVTDHLYPASPAPENRTDYFSDFFQAAYGKHELPREFDGVNVGIAMFSDIERQLYWPGLFRRPDGYYDQLVGALGSFFLELLRRLRTDVILYEGVTNSFSYFAYLAGQVTGARLLGLSMSRLPGRFEVIEGLHARHPQMKRAYDDLLAKATKLPERAEDEVAAYLANFHRIQPDYSTKAFQSRGDFGQQMSERARRLRAIAAYTMKYSDNHPYAYQWPNSMLEGYARTFVRERLRRWVKTPVVRDRYYERPPSGERYYLYAIHFHPEASTSVQGLPFVDEWNNIQQLAAAIPFGTKLYVKDHHASEGRAALTFYRDVAALPNVRLVDCNADTKALIRGSIAVITNTGTVGYEGIVLGKPVFTFGTTFYDFHPLVQRIRSFGDAPALLAAAPGRRVTQAEVDGFVRSYYLVTHEGVLDTRRAGNDPRLLSALCEIIERPSVYGSPRSSDHGSEVEA